MAEAAAGDGPNPRIPQKTFSPKLFVVPKNFLGIKTVLKGCCGFKNSWGIFCYLGVMCGNSIYIQYRSLMYDEVK